MLSSSKFLFLFVVIVTVSANKLHKKLAGPPSEFSLHALPAPIEGSVSSESAIYEVNFASGVAGGIAWDMSLPVDSTSGWGMALLSPYNADLVLSLTDPSGANVDLAQYAVQTSWPIGDYSVPALGYNFPAGAPSGLYTLSVTSTATSTVRAALGAASPVDAYLFLNNPSPISTLTHTNTYEQLVGNEIGLIARVYDNTMWNSSLGGVPTPLRDTIVSAVMEVEQPDGSEEDITMHDDGLHFDGAANDGVYGGTVQATQPGLYTVSAFISGTNSDGVAFARTSQHLLSVAEDYFDFSTAAVAAPEAANHRMKIHVPVQQNLDASGINFRAFAEVWGTDSTTGSLAPACWVGGIVNLKKVHGTPSITLDVDLNWLSKAALQEPLVLKNVYAVLADSGIPVAQSAEIPVKSSGEVSATLTSLEGSLLPLGSQHITREMREGPYPEGFNATEATVVYTMLNHGYCAASNPWNKAGNSWTNPAYFSRLSVSISNDEFSQNILSFASANGYDAWSYIGHSQGGPVGLHIRSFYFSGLDKVNPASGRLIQSLGSPYQGATMAGSSASFGKIFGIGCGDNYDMTVDGAKLWLSGIPADKRANVYFYTTQYDSGYCNFGASLIIKSPNDGVSENVFTALPGGNNMGLTLGECHTTGMSDPAQYDNFERNQIMNDNAARQPL